MVTDFDGIVDGEERNFLRVPDKPLVLMGMMGCGKSHVGRILAQEFGIQLYDIDADIEGEQGQKISDIFANYGEEHFRGLELEMVRRKVSQGFCVISLGGGAITTPDVLKLVKEKTISVWLDAPIEVLFERTQRNKNRPLLDCENPKERLQVLFDARKALYAQADIRVDSSAGDPLVAVRNIEKALYVRGDIA